MKRLLLFTGVTILALQAVFLGLRVAGDRVGMDEAWIAEWAYFEASEGHARSELFRGYCLYGERVILIHRLFVLQASGVIRIAGFHLHWLRLMVLFMSMGLLLLVWRFLKRIGCDRDTALAGAAMLLVLPAFFRAAGFFRPEIMYTLFGFASFMCHEHRQGNWLRQAFAGLLAGLAMTTHLTGFCFIAAGVVLILWERRPRDIVPYFAGVAVAVVPWLIEVIIHYDLFLIQIRGEMVTAKTSFTLISPLLNLLEEHKRLFRSPESIVATTLILTSLISTTKDSFRRNAGFFTYFAAVAVVLGMISSTKTVTYTVPLLPFGAVCFGLALADWKSGKALGRGGRLRRTMFAFAAILAVIFGLWTGVSTVTGGFYDIEDVNTCAGELIPDDARCLAPMGFIFGQIDRLQISGLYLARVLCENREMSIGYLLDYADERCIRYIVLDDYWIEHITGCEEFLIRDQYEVDVIDTGELLVLRIANRER